MLHNAQAMLRSLLGDHETRATPAGNLNRKFVAAMLDVMRFPDRYLDELHRFNKVINEQDALLVHDIRVVLELADLAHIRKGRFVVRPLGRELMRDANAGELFTRLVWTTFRVYDLGYRDRLPELPEFQQAIAFPLAVLARMPEGWHPLKTLVDDLLHPALAAKLPPSGLLNYGEIIIKLRLIEPLEALGLVQTRVETDVRSRYLDRWTHLRRTELFGAVVSVAVG